MAANPQYFAGVGATKAGTTWLANYLDEHPQVAISPLKELHYFDAVYCQELMGHWHDRWRKELVGLMQRYVNNPEDALLRRIRHIAMRLEMVDVPENYPRYFASLLEENTRAFGEITPSYSLLPRAGYQAIQALYPEARFIFIARDPVDRYLSQVRFTCKQRGLDTRAGFDANAAALSYLDSPHFLPRSDYPAMLDTLREAAPPERIYLTFYETLFGPQTNAGEVAGLCAFLGIDFVSADLQRRFNETGRIKYDDAVLKKIRAALSPSYDYMLREFGDQVPAVWLDA